jgi:hypothetical protein
MTSGIPPPEIPKREPKPDFPFRRGVVLGFVYGLSHASVPQFLEKERNREVPAASDTGRRQKQERGYDAYLIDEMIRENVNTLLRYMGERKITKHDALSCSLITNDLSNKARKYTTGRK